MSLDSQLRPEDEFYARAYKAPVEEEQGVEGKKFNVTIGEILTPFVLGNVSLGSAAGLVFLLASKEIDEYWLFSAMATISGGVGCYLLTAAFANYQDYRQERRK